MTDAAHRDARLAETQRERDEARRLCEDLDADKEELEVEVERLKRLVRELAEIVHGLGHFGDDITDQRSTFEACETPRCRRVQVFLASTDA